MKKFTLITLFFISFFYSYGVSAIKIYVCQDGKGETSFRDSCPPGTTVTGNHSYYLHREPERIPPEVTLYYVPECQWCSEVRSYFSERDILINEKDLTDNSEFQNELVNKAGELIVPTVDINGAVISGYNPAVMNTELEKFGYTEQ